jgi:Ca2+-binding RTX toxin-like protein
MGTNYLFLEHLDGEVAFNPTADRIIFPASIQATDVAPGDESFDSIFTTFIEVLSGDYAGHQITLTGDVAAPNLATSNWQFLSGGRWLIGDNDAGRVNDNAGHTLTGTQYADALAGMGGDDSMTGNGGDDFFYLSNNGAVGFDTVKGGAGVDSVFCDESVTQLVVDLTAGTLSGGMVEGDGAVLSGVENFYGGVAADRILGSGVANRLAGSDGNDTINGRAGDDQVIGNGGHDRLTGGTGADQFVFDARPAAANSDTITDFLTGLDHLVFDNGATLFTKIGPAGALGIDAFYSADGATQAHDAGDRLIYDSLGGKLYYDADGSATSKMPVLVATLAGAPGLAYTDIIVV